MNKLNTKVELRFDLAEADWLPKAVKKRLEEQRPSNVSKELEFFVSSDAHRTQEANRVEAMRKLQEYVD